MSTLAPAAAVPAAWGCSCCGSLLGPVLPAAAEGAAGAMDLAGAGVTAGLHVPPELELAMMVGCGVKATGRNKNVAEPWPDLLFVL